MADDEVMDPTVQNVLDQTTLKWIFVGGKGGVGKTTTSCSMGVLLSKVRRNVLIISTDPAHNLSDAFSQKFTSKPTLVEGYTNLSCMEVDSTTPDIPDDGTGINEGMGGLQSMMKEFSSAIPGIDEAMSFGEIMKNVESMDFDCIVFDTAPTGHTLRLLSFPTALEKGMAKILELKNKFGGMLSQVSALMGQGAGAEDALMEKLESTREIVKKVNTQFRDPELTTFICVCIPEFLSLYETERLVQELTKFGIDVHNIVVNQVLFAEPDACRKFLARKRMQDRYLDQFHELYEDFNVTVMPMRDQEVRGPEKLEVFAKYLLKPYTPPKTVQGLPGPHIVISTVAQKFGIPEDDIYAALLEKGMDVPRSS